MSDKRVDMVCLISESVSLSPHNCNEIRNGIIEFDTPLNNTLKKTGNGNLFTKSMLTKGIDEPRFQKRLRNRALYGEMDHPLRDNVERFCNVWNKYRSHLFTKFWIDNEVLMAHVETADSKYGDELYRYIRQKSIPSFSLRALGRVMRDPSNGSDETLLNILTWDNVYDGADETAWANRGSMVISNGSTPDDKHKLIMESNNFVGDIVSNKIDILPMLKDIGYKGGELKYITESLGVTPTKALYNSKGEILMLYTESMSFATRVKEDVGGKIDKYLKSLI